MPAPREAHDALDLMHDGVVDDGPDGFSSTAATDSAVGDRLDYLDRDELRTLTRGLRLLLLISQTRYAIAVRRNR